MNLKTLGFTFVVLAALLPLGMLSFQKPSVAAPPSGRTFVDAGVQRQEILRELQDIKSLLKEQNALLRAHLAPGAPIHRPAR